MGVLYIPHRYASGIDLRMRMLYQGDNDPRFGYPGNENWNFPIELSTELSPAKSELMATMVPTVSSVPTGDAPAPTTTMPTKTSPTTTSAPSRVPTTTASSSVQTTPLGRTSTTGHFLVLWVGPLIYAAFFSLP